MRLSQLETLIHVAELGSLSRAAERLHVAIPALSRQMTMLERELGVQIFVRHGRGMILTDPGQHVLRHAYRVLGELDEIRNVARDGDAGLRGHVSIGLPPTVVDALSLPLVNAMTTHNPRASLRVVSAYSRFLLDWLRRGDIDVAVLYERGPDRTLRTVKLLDQELRLVGPTSAGFSLDHPVSFAELHRAHMLLPSRGHGLREVVESAAADAGVDFVTRIEADSLSTLKDLVRAGHGLTILPFASITIEVAAGQLTYAPLIDPTPVRRLVIATAADRGVTRLVAFATAELIRTGSSLADAAAVFGHQPRECDALP
jgi:DNA-binding transcriptional LysR family regulator